jgi:hypothetical protein
VTLFAAGIALAALFFASYTTRYTWLAFGSLALSMVALAGVVFLATAKDQHAREQYVRVANGLAPVLDRQTVDTLTAAIRQVAAFRAPLPASAPVREPRAIEATATPGWPEATQKPKAAPGDPVAWLLDEGDQGPAGDGDGFRLGGVNVSDQALQDVQGLLKPDWSPRELALALDVEGRAREDEAVIPPGTRFSLAYDNAKAGRPEQDGADSSGGAILTFRYSQAGRQKTTILYLTPPILARLANRR